jgi:hypothetical protein
VAINKTDGSTINEVREARTKFEKSVAKKDYFLSIFSIDTKKGA